MTKTIDTLVSDIYKTLEEGVDTDTPEIQNALDEFSNDIVFGITNALQEGSETSKARLRLSQIGKPDRQIWYGLKGAKSETLSGQTRIKFLMGHILEAVLVLLTKSAGHSVSGQQDEIEVEGVVGHQDCIIDDTLVDIKSASSFAFKKFKENRLHEDDPFGYIAQISAYATKNDRKEAAFFAIDKNSGELTISKVHELEMIDAPARVRHLKVVQDSDTAPPKCYSDVPDGSSGNKKLATGCVFCPYKFDCWSDANDGRGLRMFRYSNGVRFLTQVIKTPNVEELSINEKKKIQT